MDNFTRDKQSMGGLLRPDPAVEATWADAEEAFLRTAIMILKESGCIDQCPGSHGIHMAKAFQNGNLHLQRGGIDGDLFIVPGRRIYKLKLERVK